MGLLGGLKPDEVIKNFEQGFGDVLSFVGVVIGLGTMLGGLLVASGGADRLAQAFVPLGGNRWVPWMIFFAALLIGLPLFFEVGFVLLAPLAVTVALRMHLPIVCVGLPMLAGLSVAHAMVPPHPAPTLAAAAFHADLGRTIPLRSAGWPACGPPGRPRLQLCLPKRVATGSATVATITAAGITSPLLAVNPAVSPELMVLASGSGSIIFSHVNDAGFWLVKETFGLSLGDTFKSWSAMETLLSVFGLLAVLLLGMFVHT